MCAEETQKNRHHQEQRKGSLISYGLVPCILSRLWPFLFSSIASADRPPCFPSPPSISLGDYLCMSAKQSVFQVRDPAYSAVWKSKSSGCLQDMQQAWSSLCLWTDSMTLQLPKRHRSGFLLPSRWLLHTHTPLLNPLKNSHWIQMVTWGGTNCRTPMGAVWKESINYTFISKCDVCSLEGHRAGQWLPCRCHWAKFNFIHFLPVVCRWGEQLPTSKVLMRSESDDMGPGHHDFLDLGVWIFHCLLAKQHIEKSVACRSRNCSWVSSNTLLQKKQGFLLSLPGSQTPGQRWMHFLTPQIPTKPLDGESSYVLSVHPFVSTTRGR